MTRLALKFDVPVAETSSPPCTLHEIESAYSGLDEDTLARARWRARRTLRRVIGADEPAGAARRRRAVCLSRASELRLVAPAQIAFAPRN